jgi:putative oxidoreductase
MLLKASGSILKVCYFFSMKDITRLFFLNFIPTNRDLSLLVLRIVFGGYMLVAHGLPKLMSFSEKASGFPDPLGIGSKYSLICTIGFEVFGALCIILGLFTRFAALSGVFTMAVAFILVHKSVFMGSGNGELAFVYLAAFLGLFIAGGGRYSLEANMGAKS